MILVSVVTLAISCGLAIILVGLNDWIGYRDLSAFFGWTVPFAGLTALMGSLISRLLQLKRAYLLYPVFGLAGYATGFVWSVVVWSSINPWFGTFSFPTLPCWLAGGAVGLLLNAAEKTSLKHGGIGMWLISSVIFVVIAVALIPFPEWMRDDQKLYQVSLQLEQGSNILDASRSSSPILASDTAFLKSLGITGSIKLVSSGTYGRGSAEARVVFVAYKQVDKPVEFQQPDGGEIFYIQGENGWTIYPANAPTLERKIRLWPDEENPYWATRFSVENADGSLQGGTAFTWTHDGM